ncbi:hypothetical protein MWU61_09750 [Loktanella sp. F6476L]|uniref:hypothetical protein n=1 Tax=Loktanella sp. F6476L TaxID=2926405 RepID=UPI001FF56586|nr:hypothetical protein [Loktanella sp. F6476L]MCK0120824.1 hypothetical protein [Loktanella sp. F6476L]
MSDTQKSPITRADVDAEEKGNVAGAHGNADNDHTGATGVSATRRGPERINPSEDVDKDK